MPLVIRELNIKVNVGQGASKAGSPTEPGGRAGSDKDAADIAVKRAVEEVMRIDASKKER